MRILARTLDVLSFIGLAAWLVGGVPLGDRWVLTHGAEPRRVAIALAALATAVPALRQHSLVARLCVHAWARLQDPRARWRLVSIVAVCSAGLGVLQVYALRSTMYDVGIYHQVVWNLAHGNGFASTLSNTPNYLLDHLSLSYVLLVPAFWVSGSHPATLAVIHAAVLWGGVAAWLWMIERLDRVPSERRQRLAAGFLLFFIGFESLWANLRWGFHDTALSFCFQSWAFALWFTSGARKWTRALVALLLLGSAFSQERLLVDVGIMFVIWAVGFGMVRARGRAAVVVLTAVALFAVFVGFESIADPARRNYFARYYGYLGERLGDVVHTALTRPWVIGVAVGWTEIAWYVVILLLPFLAMPLLGGRPDLSAGGAPEIQRVPSRVWLLAVVPSFAMAALSTFSPHRRAQFQHVFDLWPVLLLLTVFFLAQARSSRWVFAWVFLSLFSLREDPWRNMTRDWQQAAQTAPVREAFAKLPRDGWIMADDVAGTWLAGRREISRFPEREVFAGRCPDWLVLTSRTPDQFQIEVRDGLPDCSTAYAPVADLVVGGWEVHVRQGKRFSATRPVAGSVMRAAPGFLAGSHFRSVWR